MDQDQSAKPKREHKPDTAIPEGARTCSVVAARHYLGGRSHGFIYKLIQSGELKSVRIGGKRLIIVESLHGLIDSRAA